MHELSLAMEVCRLAESYVAPRKGDALCRIAVDIGDASNVEPENFRFCLEALLSSPPFGHATLQLTPQPGTDLRIAWLEVDDGSPAY